MTFIWKQEMMHAKYRIVFKSDQKYYMNVDV